MTGRVGLGNGGQDSATLRPKDSAESNEGQLLPRILPKLPERAGNGEDERWNNNLGGKISCRAVVADIVECGNKRHR